jgi:hypothetical protein
MIAANMDSMSSTVAECLNAGALKAVVDLRASPQDIERIDWLGERANEGLLTTEERQEYRSAVMLANFLGILGSKARNKLH